MLRLNVRLHNADRKVQALFADEGTAVQPSPSFVSVQEEQVGELSESQPGPSEWAGSSTNLESNPRLRPVPGL